MGKLTLAIGPTVAIAMQEMDHAIVHAIKIVKLNGPWASVFCNKNITTPSLPFKKQLNTFLDEILPLQLMVHLHLRFIELLPL